MSEINILKLNFNDVDFSHIRNIRKSVFNTELGISESELFDKHDETCDHFLIFNGKNVVGSVRIRSMGQTIKLERMAILKKFRTKNYGKNCISEIIQFIMISCLATPRQDCSWACLLRLNLMV